MKKETVVLGGGCFWCTEAVFKMLKGIISVMPGYAGGTTQNPTYASVSGGKTGHIEVVKIDYDPVTIDLKNILTVFFASHDPSTLNRQGNDVGTEYRSAILYTTSQQKEIIDAFITDINTSNQEGKPIVTEVMPLVQFYEAESYHQDYYERNKDQRYCQIIINPKLDKMQKEFADLLNDASKIK